MNNYTQQQIQERYEDEISLIDIWQTLMRRKKEIVITFITVVIAVIIYLYLAKPVYESKVTIEIGQVGQAGLYVENIESLTQRLLAEQPGLVSIAPPKGAPKNILTLTVYEDSKINAEQKLTQAVDELLIDHGKRYDALVSIERRRLETLQTRLQNYKLIENELNEHFARLKASQLAQAAMLLVEIGNIARAIPKIEEDIAKIQMAISDTQTTPTRLLGHRIVSDNPVKPNKQSIIMLAVIGGLMLGVFVAFFAEFISKVHSVKS